MSTRSQKNSTKPANQIGRAGSSVVDLANAVLARQATPEQTILFMLGALAIAAILIGGLLALFDSSQAIYVFMGLAAVITVALFRLRVDTRLPATAEVQSFPPDDLRRQVDELLREKDDITANIDLLSYHLEKAPSLPRVLLNEQSFTIDADGSVRYQRTVEIETTSRLMMLVEKFGADSPMDSVLATRFEAKCTASKLAILTASDKPTLKKVILFFLPELQPGTKASYTVSWVWKGAMEPLVKKGTDQWTSKVNNPEGARLVRFKFSVHPDLGNLGVDNIGQGGGISMDVKPDRDSQGYRLFGWEAKDVPSGTELAIRLKRL